MEVPLPPGDMGGRGPGTARGHGRKGARGCTGTRGEGARGHGGKGPGDTGTRRKGPGTSPLKPKGSRNNGHPPLLRVLTSRQDKMKFTASSGVKTLKRPSQASKINL